MTTGLNSTLYRDIVYTEYMLEHDLTWEEMMQKTHTDEMLKRVEMKSLQTWVMRMCISQTSNFTFLQIT